MKYQKPNLAIVIPVFLLSICMPAQVYGQANITVKPAEEPESVSDTIVLSVQDMNVYPCAKGNNTLQLHVSNFSNERMIFAVHVQSGIRLASSIGRGWGMVFFDTIPSGEKMRIEHSFPFYSELHKGITLRVQYYQLRMSESWDFQKYFFSRTHDYQDIASLCLLPQAYTAPPDVNIVDEFFQIQDRLREEDYSEVWNCLTKSFQEAKYQGDIKGFLSKMDKEQALDYWTATQLLQLIPEESLKLEDGRILLKSTLNSDPWSLYFKYSGDTWKLDWIEGYICLVDLWMTWQKRLIPQMQKTSTRHFDFYYYKDSYAASTINNITRTREEGYEYICQYLNLDIDQRTSTFFFNDPATKAIETGHRGKGAAYDTTIIEVYNEDMQANPYHETVHVLTSTLGTPPALFNEGFAEYMEIVLSGKDRGALQEALCETIYELKHSAEWIPIQELITFTDIPGTSPAHVSYPEAAAFVRFLIEKYGKQRFLESFRELSNSDQEAIQNENVKKLERIYGKPVEELIDEFRQFYRVGDNQITLRE
jgi:hypothetical protein